MRLFLCAVLGALGSAQAVACATCLCGDPTITTMGVEKPFAGRLRASLEYLTRGETVGDADVNEHVIDETRLTYAISYAPSARWMVAMSLPLVTKRVERFDLSHEQSSGLGDADVSLRWFLGDDQRFPARHVRGVQGGVRLPTSSEQRRGDDVIDFDAQPGAGATLASLGFWYGYFRQPWLWYSSITMQKTLSEGYQGYEAGDAVLATAMAQYGFGQAWAMQLSLDGRWKKQDYYSGSVEEDSGGVLVMATPGLAWVPVTDWVVNTTYQWPMLENAKGRQEEKPNWRLGVAYDF